jgi:hypothetical protein
MQDVAAGPAVAETVEEANDMEAAMDIEPNRSRVPQLPADKVEHPVHRGIADAR